MAQRRQWWLFVGEVENGRPMSEKRWWVWIEMEKGLRTEPERGSRAAEQQGSRIAGYLSKYLKYFSR